MAEVYHSHTCFEYSLVVLERGSIIVDILYDDPDILYLFVAWDFAIPDLRNLALNSLPLSACTPWVHLNTQHVFWDLLPV